jgi:O-antigen ligase
LSIVPTNSGSPWRDWRVILAIAAYGWMTVAGTFVGAADAAAAFGLAVLLFLGGTARRNWPELDRQLAAIAILFIALCWASTAWSIAPSHSAHGALQITLVAAGALILLGERKPLAHGATTILLAALTGATIGAALGLVDFHASFPIMRHLLPPNAPEYAMGSKMDRGLSYLVFLAWPLLAFAWRDRSRVWACLLAALVIALVGSSHGVTVQLSLLTGIVAFAIAAVAPRLVALGLALGSVAAAALTPILALDFGARLLPWAQRIKPSAVHRLEIWDYMSRRALERPLTGWGWWTAHMLPIHPDELARYQYVTPNGSPHPHGNWVQLWVETGVFGVALGLAFALLILWRAWRMPSPYRPFALACCASVFIIAMASFDLATDSWWAALAATGLLFALLPVPMANGRAAA